MIQILPNKTMDLVVKELKTLKKDAVRKVCKQCHELGHGISSVHCAVNIDQRNRLRQKLNATCCLKLHWIRIVFLN